MRIVRLWRRWCPALRFVDNNGSPFEDNGRATSSNAIQWQEIFFACNVVRPMAAVHGHEALPSLMHDPYDTVIDSRLFMQLRLSLRACGLRQADMMIMQQNGNVCIPMKGTTGTREVSQRGSCLHTLGLNLTLSDHPGRQSADGHFPCNQHQ